MQKRIAELPQGCVHAWCGETIVGQIESRIRDDGSGYVNLFYLAPNVRGRGLGHELNRYAIRLFASLDVTIMRLTVAAENKAAISFYERVGWKNRGPRPGRNGVLLFEYSIDKSSCDR